MRLVGSIRVSTEDQADSGISLAGQADRIRALACAHGHELVDPIEEDAGISAATMKRPGLKRALARLDAGEAEGLAVAKLDRLTRCLADFELLLARHFGPRGRHQLLSAAETLELKVASGLFTARILVAASQFELERGKERTVDAVGVKRCRGERLGTIPYGRRLAEDGKTLVPDEAELEVIGRIVLLRLGPYPPTPLQAIADQLNAAGIPTRKGGPWRKSTVAGILGRDAEPAPTT